MNKENKDTKVGKSTNYLRKILSNELENNAGQDKVNEIRNTSPYDVKKDAFDVRPLGDHSYFEHVKEDIANGESMSNISKVPVNSLTNENVSTFVQ